MIINRNNFEEYFVDYLEGNLDPLISAELMAFLAENPEYEKYIPENDLNLPAPGIEHYPGRNLLKKGFSDIEEINESNFDEFCIAASEGLLDKEQTGRLTRYIGEDSRKRRNLELFNSLRIVPDMSIHFDDKDRIRKNPIKTLSATLYFGLAIAASVTIVLLLTLNSPVRDTNISQQNTRAISGNINTDENRIVAPDTHPETSHDIRVPSNPAGSGIAPEESKNSEAVSTEPAFESASPYPVEISFMEPVTRKLHVPVQPLMSASFAELTADNNPGSAKTRKQPFIDSNNLFSELFSKLNLWKTAESAINGFNYLTEAQLSINKTTDEQGRLTELSLNTESYTIAGKLK
jgi:hypothetical protein